MPTSRHSHTPHTETEGRKRSRRSMVSRSEKMNTHEIPMLNTGAITVVDKDNTVSQKSDENTNNSSNINIRNGIDSKTIKKKENLGNEKTESENVDGVVSFRERLVDEKADDCREDRKENRKEEEIKGEGETFKGRKIANLFKKNSKENNRLRRNLIILVNILLPLCIYLYLPKQQFNIGTRRHANGLEIADNQDNCVDGCMNEIAEIYDVLDDEFRFENEYNLTHGCYSERMIFEKKQFNEKIEKISESVYVAVGFGLANTVFIKGKEGWILIDTMEGVKPMQNVFNHFNKSFGFVPKIRAIIFSHFHSDHTFGAEVAYTEEFTEVWAHQRTVNEIQKVFQVTAGATYKRAMKQFGSKLGAEHGFIHSGIGARLYYDSDTVIGVRTADRIWEGEVKEASIAGEDLVLLHTPGESQDQISIWFPRENMMFASDNFYKSFPNIYAIRGSESRDSLLWINSIDTLRRYPIDILTSGHTDTIIGKEKIQNLLTDYRDAIQYIHDQTVRYMNQGLSADEAVTLIELPTHLKQNPYLYEIYGTMQWAIRGVFAHYLGWFSGKAEDLNPLHPTKKANRIIQLAGGVEQMTKAMTEAYEENEYQWSLELSSHVLAVHQSHEAAREIRKKSLLSLASTQTSAAGRNWYLSTLMEVEEKLDLKISHMQKIQAIDHIDDSAQLFQMIPSRLNPKKAGDAYTSILFRFVDTEIDICLHIRRGVAFSLNECEYGPETMVETTDEVWRSIMKGSMSSIGAYLLRKLRIKKGSILHVRKVFQFVDFDDEI